MTTVIHYQREENLDVAELIDVLRRSTLAERRPIDDLARMADMIRHCDILVTARNDEGLLVGISRALSDFSYSTYVADLAVDEAYQGRGIGRELLQRTHDAAGRQTMLILLAAPKAESYYPHIGMTQHHSCWFFPRSAP